MPVSFNPVLAGLNARSQSLSGCPSPHPRLSFGISFPIKLEAEEGEPTFAARMKATEAVDAGLLRSDLQAKLGQPLGQGPVEPFRFSAVLKGTDKIIRKADDVRLPLTVGFDHPFEPMVQRVVEIDVCQDWRNHTPLLCPGLWVKHGTVPFQYARFQPGVDESEKRLVVNPLFSHPQKPIMVNVIEKAAYVGLYHIAISAKLEFEGQVFDRLLCASLWPIAIADRVEVSFINRFQQQPGRPLEQPVLRCYPSNRDSGIPGACSVTY